MRPIFAISWIFVGLAILVHPGTVSYATTIAFYSDGVIQKGDTYDKVEVYDTPPEHTVVDMYGQIGDLFVHDGSTFNYIRGSIWGDAVADGASTVNIRSGGVIFDRLSMNTFYIEGSSTVNAYSGFVGAITLAQDSSTVNIYGGTWNHLSLADSATANIYGGAIGHGWGFFIKPSASANIYGSGFIYDPEWRWYEDDWKWGTRWVSLFTGIGPDGVPIEITGMPDPFTSPNINLIPEPGTALLLGSGSLGLLRRRKLNG
jgi:hypothetical protein